ncbi:MAG TPA: VOC family protein [Myxococcota bacterium]|nr:VOC family protein [Myxococcota bacterium]
MLTAIHSVRVEVADIETAAADFGRLLGRPAAWWERSVGADRRSAFFATGGGPWLEVRASEAERGEPDRGLAALVLRRDEAQAGKESGPNAVARGEAESGPNAVARGEAESGPNAEPGRARVMRADRVDTHGGRSWVLETLDPRSTRGIGLEILSGERFDGGPSPAAGATRAADGVERSAVDGLDHVVVLGHDLDASRRLYGDRLGLRLALDRSFPERGVRLLFFRLGGVTIELGGRLGVAAEVDRSDRFGGLAFRVADVDATRTRLVAEGFEVGAVRAGHKPGTRVCTVHRPVHAVPTLLIEPAARSHEPRGANDGSAHGDGAADRADLARG